MPNLCMCKVETCPKKDKCYRFMAIESEPHQPYANYEEICTKKNKYAWFYKIDGKKIREVKPKLDSDSSVLLNTNSDSEINVDNK